MNWRDRIGIKRKDGGHGVDMMDPVDSNENGHLSNEMSVGRLLPSDNSASCDLFHEQDIFPRIGANYQVEIPQLVERSEYLLLLRNVENGENGAIEYFVGLPMPVLLISQEHESTKVEKTKVRQSLNPSRKGRGASENSNIDPMNVRLHDGPVIESADSDYRFVPLSGTGCWTDMEMSSFLLGLYIFEKHFVHLARFIETKNLGEIMSFYYGKFYRSHEYCRWSESRKMRSRRCVFGQKIFTGVRQQEFLSRLINNVSEECKNALLEVSKTFGEGKMPLVEYIFSLKAMVGMSMLVEAVGIGKGKQDLTGMALEPFRSNQSIQMRPEIPTGKACSYLTPSEIVKFLTGDYRLSKARSNDLFWEAVWPRLLARGWHSEEPKDQSYTASSKNPLVFLVPGVKKFSRRRLVKGNHYFDSVSDVLSRVALEPSLIELDTEEDESKRNKEELQGKSKRMLEEDDVRTRRRRFYLQPRTPYRATESMKFTIIDSSTVGEGAYKIRELRGLSREYSNNFNPGNLFKLSDGDSPEVSTEESDAVETAFSNKWENDISNASNDLSNGEMLSDRKGLQISAPKWENDTSYHDSESVPVNNSGRTNFLEDKQSKKKEKKRQLSQRTKEDNVQDMYPVNKRARRLTVCNQLETSNFTVNSGISLASESELPTHSMDICNLAENVPPQASSLNKLYLSNESKGSHADSVECDTVNYHVVSDPQESSQNQTLIDLNVPQVPADFENDVLMANATESKDKEANNPGGDAALEPALDVVSSEQQSNMNQQRRGTRNRPPTSRALEALANGFLTVNSRRKGKEASSQARSTSRSSRHARGSAGLGFVTQSPHQPNLENTESRTEFSPTSVCSTFQGGQNVAGSDADKVQFGEYEVLSPENRAPTSGN